MRRRASSLWRVRRRISIRSWHWSSRQLVGKTMSPYAERGASFMTEERARYYAKVLARSIGTTFYAVRSREGRFLAVQIPSGDCDILAAVKPPSGSTLTLVSRGGLFR